MSLIPDTPDSSVDDASIKDASPEDSNPGFARLLKEEKTEPALAFRVFKSMPYPTRMLIVSGLVVLGILLQFLFVRFWPGAPFLLAAFVLSWVKGFDNKLDSRTYKADSDWETVEYERLGEILALKKKINRWDSSLWDISNGKGIVFFIFVVFVGYILLQIFGAHKTAAYPIILGDAGLLILTQWFNGMRYVDKQPDLILKTEHLVKTVEHLRRYEILNGEIGAMLLLAASDKGLTPQGVKITVRFPDAPEDFFGVQSQVVINRVQSKAHPYCYSVVVAKKGKKLFRAIERLDPPPGCIFETDTKGNADVVIIRQRTSRTSGYHTNVDTSAMTLASALQIAETWFKQRH